MDDLTCAEHIGYQIMDSLDDDVKAQLYALLERDNETPRD